MPTEDQHQEIAWLMREGCPEEVADLLNQSKPKLCENRRAKPRLRMPPALDYLWNHSPLFQLHYECKPQRWQAVRRLPEVYHLAHHG